MEMEYLCEFTVIAKLESFSRAAEELCISQSSLSKHILALERELGVPLLVRNSRNVTLSPAGAQILPMAAQIYELKNKIQVVADKENSRGKTILSIASIPVMAQYNITGALAKFQRAFPKVTLEVMECEQQELRTRLEKDGCELAFLRRGMDMGENLEYMEFCRDTLVAVVPAAHSLAGRESIGLLELQGQPLLFLDQQTGLQNLCQSLCREAGFAPQVIYTGHRPENIVELSAQNMGIALLMKRHTDYVKNPHVRCVDIAPPVESSVCLVRKKNHRHTVLAGEFWAFIREHRLSDSPPE